MTESTVLRVQSHVRVVTQREVENHMSERDTEIHCSLSLSLFSALRRLKTPSWDCTLIIHFTAL